MSDNFSTLYQALSTSGDEEEQELESPPSGNMVQMLPEQHKGRWPPVKDLDEFFSRIYQYHRRSGFLCMIVQDFFQQAQFIFIILFSSFLIKCVDYDVLFYEKHYNATHKVKLGEAVIPIGQCVSRFNTMMIICLIISLVFWLYRFAKFVYNTFLYWEMRMFYHHTLKINSGELVNITWYDVQKRLLEVQKEQEICRLKRELTELDIYHRMLRFKNYMIAMTNKSLLPLKYQMPVFGEYVFLSSGLKYNLEMILFWGPWSPFENSWHLKADYKHAHKRKELGQYLSKRILWIGLANLILSPIIFLWQILYTFFRYTEILKREPSVLGSRHWSLYSHLYLRHFNELEHEFSARLNRAYKPAERYMNIFVSPLLVILAKNVAFFAGSFLAVLVILTVYDEDILAVQHVIGIMTTLGLVMALCRVLIPDEYMVWCPELLLRAVLSQVHYMPDSWKGNAHTLTVRSQFGQLFQYKAVNLFEELISPLVTPIILCFPLRRRAQNIVDFFHNFTIDLAGVGDVCSFAQMDIGRHGNPEWNLKPEHETEVMSKEPQKDQAEDGKTEMSLLHFTLMNPDWKPPETESLFISTLRNQAQRDAETAAATGPQSPTSNGMAYRSLILGGPSSQNWMFSRPSLISRSSRYSHDGPRSNLTMSNLRGGLQNTEGPLPDVNADFSTAAYMSHFSDDIGTAPLSLGYSLSPLPEVHGHIEMTAAEMNYSALYMHDLHMYHRGRPHDTNDEYARQLWQTSPEHHGSSDRRERTGEQEESDAIQRSDVTI